MEKRAFPRVRAVFPLQINNFSGSPDMPDAETVNVSESGLKFVSSQLLLGGQEMVINLPPCYAYDPNLASGICVSGRITRVSEASGKEKFFYGFAFDTASKKEAGLWKSIIAYELEKIKPKKKAENRPKIQISREPHSCNMYAVDLTVGCESECSYCHFSKANEDFLKIACGFDQAEFPMPVDISGIYKMKKFPDSVVYLSPSSDAFAPKAAGLTHELLSFLLPKGVLFTISTKNIIPDKTIALLKKYSHLIEGIAVGLTNLSDERNNILERGCPSAGQRLEHIRQLKEIGCFIGSRMDPIFPLIDDTEENLENTVRELAGAGAGHITGTYLFTYGRRLRELKKHPVLSRSMEMITEKTYPMGGSAFSVPLEYKKRMYQKINEKALHYGIKFNTCGCKDVVLKETGYPLVCRNISYYT